MKGTISCVVFEWHSVWDRAGLGSDPVYGALSGAATKKIYLDIKFIRPENGILALPFLLWCLSVVLCITSRAARDLEVDEEVICQH